MLPVKPHRQASSKSLLRQQEAARPSPSQQQAEALQTQSPGRCVSASVAKFKKPPPRPKPWLLMAPEAARNQRASSKCRERSRISLVPAQPASCISQAKAKGRRGTQAQEKKKRESPKRYPSPDEPDHKSLRGKTTACIPEVPVNVDRRYTRCAQKGTDCAGLVVDVGDIPGQRGQKLVRNQSRATLQGAAQAVLVPSDVDKHRGASPRQYSRSAVEARKLSAKSSRGAASAAKGTNFVVPVKSDAPATGPPKKSATSLPAASTGNTLKPALPSAKYAKDAPPREVSEVPAGPADPLEQKWPSARLRGAVEEPGVPRCPGWPRYPRASSAGARVEPTEIRGPGNVQRALKFDPFKAPSSVMEDLVDTSEESFMPPRANAAPGKLQNKSLSSFLGLHDSSETNDDAQKRLVATTMGRHQIVAMQGVAGFCVLAIIIATTLFLGYYVSWSIENREESIYTTLTADDADNDTNRTLPIFPSYLGNEKWMQSEPLN